MKLTTEIVRFEVRLGAPLNAAIQERADKGDRSKNAQIIRALRYYLENTKEDE